MGAGRNTGTESELVPVDEGRSRVPAESSGNLLSSRRRKLQLNGPAAHSGDLVFWGNALRTELARAQARSAPVLRLVLRP